jgi:excisionase family DNA binding protein
MLKHQTLTLEEAAHFLKMSPECLRRKVKAGDIPGCKPGKKWVFLEDRLVEWLSISNLKAANPLNLNINETSKETKCQSTNVKTSGGYNLRPHRGKGYKDLLALR